MDSREAENAADVSAINDPLPLSAARILATIVDVAKSQAGGYDKDDSKEGRSGSVAASNTGYFIARALGFSNVEIRDAVAKFDTALGKAER